MFVDQKNAVKIQLFYDMGCGVKPAHIIFYIFVLTLSRKGHVHILAYRRPGLQHKYQRLGILAGITIQGPKKADEITREFISIIIFMGMFDSKLN